MKLHHTGHTFRQIKKCSRSASETLINIKIQNI